jgi:hypothetical protein
MEISRFRKSKPNFLFCETKQNGSARSHSRSPFSHGHGRCADVAVSSPPPPCRLAGRVEVQQQQATAPPPTATRKPAQAQHGRSRTTARPGSRTGPRRPQPANHHPVWGRAHNSGRAGGPPDSERSASVQWHAIVGRWPAFRKSAGVRGCWWGRDRRWYMRHASMTSGV